ncbi:MAG TPA: V-type ATPase 116kDa subunit family protein [Actinomycetota bacterium]
MLVQMAKVQILGYGPRLDETLDALYGTRLLQVSDVRDEPGLRLEPLRVDEPRARRAEELRQLGTRLDAVIGLVPRDLRPEPAGAAEPDLGSVRAELDELAPEIGSAVRELDDLGAEQAALPRHVGSLRRLEPLLPDVVTLASYDTVALLLERGHEDLFELLRDELEGLVGSRYHLSWAPVGADMVGAVIVFPRSESSRVQAWLNREQVAPVRLPSEFSGLPLPRALDSMQERLARLPEEIASARRRLHELLAPRLERWIRARRLVDAELEEQDAARKVGGTGRAFVIAGWAPRTRVPDLRRALEERVGGEVMVVELPIAAQERDRVPLLLDNPAPARPFEFLIRLLGLPRYGTTDPTLLTALFLPLFFGLMVGDVAYGLILGGLALLLPRVRPRSQAWRDLCRILLLGSVWAVLWGIVFGEAFGDLGRDLGMRPIWMNREDAIEPFLLLAVAIGVFHVLLGLLLGVWGAWRGRQRRTLIERGGMLAALIGLFLLAAVAADRLPSGMSSLGVGALVAGLVLLIYVEGALGFVLAPLEVMGTVTNILSYLRLAALGLASVYLARVANDLGGAAGPIWVGVLIAVLLHALNVVLAGFSPMIQAIRLHYVEFYGKFFETGGRAFRPLGRPGTGDATPGTP